jgi:hypothetical protein
MTFRFPPGAQVYGVERDAEQVRGDKTKLRRAQADQAKNHAIHTCQEPPLPVPAADENCGTDGKNARQVIQPERHCASFDKTSMQHIG